MNIVNRICKGISCGLFTVAAKVKWNSSFHVKGVFRRLWDTQVIISDGGKITIGNHVVFSEKGLFNCVRGGGNHWEQCIF